MPRLRLGETDITRAAEIPLPAAGGFAEGVDLRAFELPAGLSRAAPLEETTRGSAAHAEALEKAPGEAMSDATLLAKLLGFVLPQGAASGAASGAAPLAHAVVTRFGSFAAVLAANERELRAVPGLGTHCIAAIKLQLERIESDYDREKLQERLASLTGGIAVIRVGGATEIEIREKKDRIQNAMHATRAAVEEGILPGGGVALLRASRLADNLKTENDDQKAGIAIVREAITWPARQIAANAGANGSVVVAKILDKNDNGFGFDAQTCEFGDLMARGIIDPAKVVRSALQGAASIAGLLITTEAMVAEVPGPPPPELPGHHDHEDHLDMEF